MKVLFMGTPDFAVPCLKALILKHEVTAVITQPDKKQGRGKRLQSPPVKQVSVEYNISTFQPEKIKSLEFIEEIKKINADIFVVVAYGQILPESILHIPKYGCINVHASLLPKYRGAAPIQWAIINGEEKTGVTIMYMDKGLDTGDMILKKQFDILSDDTYGTIHDKMSKIGSEALIEALEIIENDNVKRESQDNENSCYAPMITKETGRINWDCNSREIVNLIRGLNPFPIAFSTYKGEVLKIWNAEKFTQNKTAYPGEVLDLINDKGIVVKTSDGSIIINEIQKLGGKRMSTSDFLRGNKIEIGEILGNS